MLFLEFVLWVWNGLDLNLRLQEMNVSCLGCFKVLFLELVFWNRNDFDFGFKRVF